MWQLGTAVFADMIIVKLCFFRGICGSGDPKVLDHVKSLVDKLAKAYLTVFQKAVERHEFFGLRDFYRCERTLYFTGISDRNNSEKRFLIAFTYVTSVFDLHKKCDPVISVWWTEHLHFLVWKFPFLLLSVCFHLYVGKCFRMCFRLILFTS